jgi:hypothetical protein
MRKTLVALTIKALSFGYFQLRLLELLQFGLQPLGLQGGGRITYTYQICPHYKKLVNSGGILTRSGDICDAAGETISGWQPWIIALRIHPARNHSWEYRRHPSLIRRLREDGSPAL